jgi:hypothetical protein
MIACSLAGTLLVMACISWQDDKHIKDARIPANGKGFAVVELFTSEGCSSCPPADELMARIQQQYKDSQVYILAFHVDYWDRLGWPDRFSHHSFTSRQRWYAELLRLRSVYTPQVVVNGTTEYVGSRGEPILKAINGGLDQPSTTSLVLKGRVEGKKLIVEYQTGGDGKRADLVLTLVQQSAKSNVKAGENAGKDLSHVQVVRRMARVTIDKNNTKNVTLELPTDFSSTGWELIGFVQHKNDGRIIAAAKSLI